MIVYGQVQYVEPNTSKFGYLDPLSHYARGDVDRMLTARSNDHVVICYIPGPYRAYHIMTFGPICLP